MSARRSGAGLAGLLVAVALAGCGSPADAGGAPGAARTSVSSSAAASPAASPSSPTQPAASDGIEASTLRAMGFGNGPGEFPLPADLIIDYQVDNPNNITLVIDPSQGGQTYRFLRSRLRDAGYVISADGQQSLVFSGKGWEGAYTVSNGVAALTLRQP
ncbi:MAG: hypothetical protein LKI24_05100 [Acidipropionibacterium sp.]|nr:hypothetical protein [Acidipropionibacterium sp.]